MTTLLYSDIIILSSTHKKVRYLHKVECKGDIQMEKKTNRCIASERLCDTGFSYTLSLISGKYKMTILYTLMEFGVVRYNELQRYIKGISYKSLSSSLKELEADELIIRKEYPQIPPKVEYSLSERGQSLMPILDGMCEWGDRNRKPRKEIYDL